MATTSKGIYYPNDGTKKADVMADMQRMAESIDDALTENEFDSTEINQNISNLQVSQKAQDLAIENLQEAFLNGTVDESQSLEVDDAKGIGKLEVLGNYEQTGEPSEENPIAIKCVGNNKKNLFSLDSKIENVYLSISSLVEANQDYDIYYTEINPEKKYVLSMKYKEGWAKGYNVRFGYNDEIPQINDEIYYSTTEILGDISSTYTFNPSTIWDYDRWCKYLFIAIPKEAFEDISNIQLEEGDTRTEYVPYGQGSTEIKIENFDKTQLKNYNLIIQKEMLLGDYFEKEADGWKEIHNWEKINSYNGENITTDYISTTGALTIGATVYYKLQTPDILTCIKEQVEILNQLDNLELFEGINYISTTEDIALLKLKYVTNKDGLAEIKEDISNLKTEQTEQNEQIDILLNALPSETQEDENINIKGTIPVKFKEFKLSGNSKQETRSGKNIVNINSTDIVNIDTTIEVENNTLTVTGSSTTNFYSAIPIKLKPNTDYSISTLATVVEQNGLSQSAYIRVRSDLAGSWIGNSIFINKDSTTQQNLKGTFNSGDNENAYLILYLSPLNDGTQRSAKIEFENLQIEEGTQATDYEPYGAMPSPEYPSEIQNVEGDVNVTVANKEKTEQQTVTFPLSEGQKLMLGDYLASDGIHHVRKQMELDGTEDWALALTNTDTLTFQIVNNNLPVKIPNDNDEIVMISNYFKGFSRNQFNNDKETESISPNISNGSKAIIITINKTTAENLNDFKSWLAAQKQAGTPVIIEYELAEEEIEAYTEEQQEAYNQIGNVIADYEERNVYSANEVGPVFTVTAVQNTNAVLTQLKQLILEGGN